MKHPMRKMIEFRTSQKSNFTPEVDFGSLKRQKYISAGNEKEKPELNRLEIKPL